MTHYLVGISTYYGSSYLAIAKMHHGYDYLGIYSDEYTYWNSACLTISRRSISSLSDHINR